jgi:hypothetical protein
MPVSYDNTKYDYASLGKFLSYSSISWMNKHSVNVE